MPDKSRMSGDVHVRFCERPGGQFPGSTRPMAESFFATLECELIDRVTMRDPGEAKRELFGFIEGWYNPHRRHSSIDYLSPANYERRYHESQHEHTPLVGIPRVHKPDQSPQPASLT